MDSPVVNAHVIKKILDRTDEELRCRRRRAITAIRILSTQDRTLQSSPGASER